MHVVPRIMYVCLIYIYIYLCVRVCVFVYVYIYIMFMLGMNAYVIKYRLVFVR